jgi:hypothetical protein
VYVASILSRRSTDSHSQMRPTPSSTKTSSGTATLCLLTTHLGRRDPPQMSSLSSGRPIRISRIRSATLWDLDSRGVTASSRRLQRRDWPILVNMVLVSSSFSFGTLPAADWYCID